MKAVLCKKTKYPFKAGKWYQAKLSVGPQGSEDIPDSYWIDDGSKLGAGGRLYLKKIKNQYLFSDYFFTDKELRKQKLNKINENSLR